MSWMSRLCETYDNNLSKAGISGDDTPPLSVISHMVAKAQLEIMIDDKGNFMEVHEVDKNDCATIIPVTESSGGRASGIAPHPLSDTLSYIAKDYSVFAATEKEQKKAEAKFLAYADQLRKWTESENSHSKVRAVYTYIEKGTVISDLIKAGIIKTDESGKMTSGKISGQIYEKALVRFRVMSSDDDSTSACWQDAELFKSFADYYISAQPGKQDVCYITGDTATICTNHPKGIVQSNYGAKLVSANDASGFTYRGRFEDADQACTVSYMATQKAHNALSWLARIQGYAVGTTEKRTYVCWCPEGKPVVNVLSAEMFMLDDLPCSTHSELKKSMRDLFNGRKAEFDVADDVVLIVLDAATKGRLSITYYNEFKANDFFDRMESWGETCCWYFKVKTPDGKYKDEPRVPDTRKLIENAFGGEQGDFVSVSDKLLKEQTQRIVHCMADKKPVPRDILHALLIKASNQQSYQKWWNYENVLSTACAVTAKYYNDISRSKNEEVKYTMALDKNIKDRSYLFGRLLAIAEKVERSTFDSDEKREPNAIRFQSAFVNHPLKTWSVIDGKLVPYYKRLNPGSRIFYKNMVGEIFESLTDIYKSEELNRSLDEKYLLGYYLQRKELYKKDEKENKEEEK